MRNLLFPSLGLLLLSGCYSGNSIRVTEDKDLMVRERGYVHINPVRMTEISTSDTLLNLDTLVKDNVAFDYLKNSKQEELISYQQKSIALAGSMGKNIEDTDKTAKAADFDLEKIGTNSTQLAYSDLIELTVNSQMLARSMIRRFSNIKAPSSRHKLYCIPIDITFFPGTITGQNYRADIIIKFRTSGEKGKGKHPQGIVANEQFKIFAVAPYEYSKISATMQTRLKELFVTVAAKGTFKGIDVEGRFDEVIRNFNKLQSILSRPEITATLIEDDTILFSYFGYSDLDKNRHLMDGESFRCELFAYYAPHKDSEIGNENVDCKAMLYDYIWQYTPTNDSRWFSIFNPRNWYRPFPPSELSETKYEIQTSQTAEPPFGGWEQDNMEKGELQSYRYCRTGNQLWIDNLIKSNVTINHIYLIGENLPVNNVSNSIITVKTEAENALNEVAAESEIIKLAADALPMANNMQENAKPLTDTAQKMADKTKLILTKATEIVDKQKHATDDTAKKRFNLAIKVQSAAKAANDIANNVARDIAAIANTQNGKKLLIEGSGFASLANIIKEKHETVEAKLDDYELTLNKDNVNATSLIAFCNSAALKAGTQAVLTVYVKKGNNSHLLLAQKVKIEALEDESPDSPTEKKIVITKDTKSAGGKTSIKTVTVVTAPAEREATPNDNTAGVTVNTSAILDGGAAASQRKGK